MCRKFLIDMHVLSFYSLISNLLVSLLVFVFLYCFIDYYSAYCVLLFGKLQVLFFNINYMKMFYVHGRMYNIIQVSTCCWFSRRLQLLSSAIRFSGQGVRILRMWKINVEKTRKNLKMIKN